MHSFHCEGWVTVTIGGDLKHCAFIQLKHKVDHGPYYSIEVPSEVKEYVLKNSEMTLWTEITKRWPNPTFTRRSIYHIVANIKRQKWQRHEDEYESAKILLEESKVERPDNPYGIVESLDNLPNVDGYSAIAFSLPKVLAEWGGKVREIALDSAWNTNGSRYELYALLGELYGSGCPLGYLLLQSPKEGEAGVKQRFISCFLEHFKTHYGLDPSFTLTDKNLSEINAFLETYPNAKHQLCFWHALRAIKTRLSILRRQPKYYNVTEAY
ncbi:hypothetical protein K435DRAFT_601431, partial [Dendrothele bispora CBS 962.96]